MPGKNRKTTIVTVSEADLLAYSSGLQKSYGKSAHGYARRRAADLKDCGDIEGEAVWQNLAGILEREGNRS